MNYESHLQKKSWSERLEEARKLHDKLNEEFESDRHEESENCGELEMDR